MLQLCIYNLLRHVFCTFLYKYVYVIFCMVNIEILSVRLLAFHGIVYWGFHHPNLSVVVVGMC